MTVSVYLDYNATAPLRPQAWQVMEPLLSNMHGAHNASAVHGFGRDGRKVVEQARREVAALIGAAPNQVIFNSGATEGNNTVLKHFIETYPDDVILVSATEHPSVLEAIERLDNVKSIPVNSNGEIDKDALETLMSEDTVSLVSIMFGNNETGLIQNVSDLSQIIHRNGALFHCDATQAAGRVAVNMAGVGIDFLTISAHKIGGPQGIGALALGLCGQTPTLLFGGGQEKSARAGTENVPSIAGFGAAAKAALEGLDEYQTHTGALIGHLESTLKTISPEIIIHSKQANRLPNTCFFSLPGGDAQSLLMALDLEGIAVSNGSACSSGTVKPSTTLKAMGCDEKIASSALRISVGWATTMDDIEAFLNAWTKIYDRVKP